MVENDEITLTFEVESGIEALKDYLGPAHEEVLTFVTPLDKHLAGLHVVLPTDYLGKDRILYIGFSRDFPRDGLKLKLLPPPELDWPHNLYDSLCLFGIGQNPPYGDAKAVVEKTMVRFSMLLEMVIMGGDSDARTKEYESEITNYWRHQLKSLGQQLILLDRPDQSGPLYVLSDQRWRPNIGEQYYWLAHDPKKLQEHLARLTGTREAIKYPAQAAYFIRLKSIPGIKIPTTSTLDSWLLPNMDVQELDDYKNWLRQSSKFNLRWLIFQLPGDALTIHSFVLRDKAINEKFHITYGKRSERRRPNYTNPIGSNNLFYAPTHQVSRETMNSRNPAFKDRNISKKNVLMVGVGSLGSKVTIELIKEGIENITLLDPDQLSDSNPGRHVLGVDDLGRQKVVALKELINRDSPLVNVEVVDNFLHLHLWQHPNFLDQFDMIVVTTADWWSEERLGQLKALGSKWTLVQAWSEPNAIVGHVLTVPENCSDDITQFFDAKGNFQHSFTDFPDHGYVPLPNCGAGFIPGGPLGLTQIAALVATASIELLTGEETKATWQSWVGDISKTTKYGGIYSGPQLPAGITTATYKRDWPAVDGK